MNNMNNMYENYGKVILYKLIIWIFFSISYVLLKFDCFLVLKNLQVNFKQSALL